MGFAVCYPVIFGRSLEVFPGLRGTASSMIMSIRSLLVGAFTALSSALFDDDLTIIAGIMSIGVVAAAILAFRPLGTTSAAKAYEGGL